jgi:hypothetical protein
MGMIMFFMIRSTHSAKCLFCIRHFRGNEVLALAGLSWRCPQHEGCDYSLPAEGLKHTPCWKVPKQTCETLAGPGLMLNKEEKSGWLTYISRSHVGPCGSVYWSLEVCKFYYQNIWLQLLNPVKDMARYCAGDAVLFSDVRNNPGQCSSWWIQRID